MNGGHMDVQKRYLPPIPFATKVKKYGNLISQRVSLAVGNLLK